jgi:hypothetical protein
MSTRGFARVVHENGPSAPTEPGLFIDVLTAAVGTLGSVATITTAEQAVTVIGVATGDIILRVEKPTHQAGLGVLGGRVSAADTVQVKFVNPTAGGITPTGDEVYSFVVLRHNR